MFNADRHPEVQSPANTAYEQTTYARLIPGPMAHESFEFQLPDQIILNACRNAAKKRIDYSTH
jgi:hypothetical protein